MNEKDFSLRLNEIRYPSLYDERLAATRRVLQVAPPTTLQKLESIYWRVRAIVLRLLKRR